MIKEIEFPLPTIREKPIYWGQKIRVRLKQTEWQKKNRLLSLYDFVGFSLDQSFVSEFAELAGVDENFAQEFLMVFYDEIKKCLITGHIIQLDRLGKFYLGQGNMDEKQKVHDCINPRNVKPRFSAMESLRRKLRDLYKSS